MWQERNIRLIIHCPIKMKYRVFNLILVSLLLATAVRAQTVFSFETTVPDGFSTSSGSTLSISGAKYKLGLSSLKWDCLAGATLTVASSELTTASQLSGGGLTVWIYNTATSSDKLTFSFYNSSGTLDCKKNFNLQFTGWRCFWLSFSDMGHSTSNALSSLVIKSPATAAGTLYFDYLVFQKVLTGKEYRTHSIP